MTHNDLISETRVIGNVPVQIIDEQLGILQLVQCINVHVGTMYTIQRSLSNYNQSTT